MSIGVSRRLQGDCKEIERQDRNALAIKNSVALLPRFIEPLSDRLRTKEPGVAGDVVDDDWTG